MHLRAANLNVKPQKCELFLDRLDYMGHKVSREGIRPSKSKVAGPHDWAEPHSVSEVRTFLELTSYYRRFIDNDSKLVVLLTRLLKKESVWKDPERLPEDAVRAFEVLKQSLIDETPLNQREISF